jgi:folate-binding protein YgfZ
MSDPTFLVQGRDARRYLHGRLTQDIKSMTIGSTRRSLLLTPQGRVQGKFRVICAGENDFVLISDPLSSAAERSELIANLLQFKVSDEVILKELNGDNVKEQIRLLVGEPLIGKELTEKTMGTDIDVTEYVSFNKGCYTGQEPVEMSTARGRPNRALIHFFVEGEIKNLEGVEIGSSGKITSASFIPELKKTFGLGFVKFDQREEKLLSAGGHQLTVISK